MPLESICRPRSGRDRLAPVENVAMTKHRMIVEERNYWFVDVECDQPSDAEGHAVEAFEQIANPWETLEQAASSRCKAQSASTFKEPDEEDAVAHAMGATIAEEVQEIVAKETRRALREHEDKLTTLVRAAVASAIEELLNGKAA